MSALHHSRHEQFTQLVATGRTPAEAYAGVGYAEKTAYTCGPRLLKKPSVQARVSELQQTVATAAVTRAMLDREFVLRELMDNALQAKQNREWSASNRALELLGKKLGMFTPAELPWDGDPATLSDTQLDQLYRYLERIACGGDEAKIQAVHKRAMLEVGLVVEIEPTSESTQEPAVSVPTQDEW